MHTTIDRARLLARLSLALALTGTLGCKKKQETDEPEPTSAASADAADTDEPSDAAPAAAVSDAPTSADARSVRHPAAALELDIPPDWKHEQDDNALMFQSPDEGVLMVLTAVPAADLEAALETLDKQLSEMITESELSAFKEGEIHGMPAVFADGQGKLDGVSIELGIILVLAPDGNVVIALGLAQPDVAEKTGHELSRLLASIRPAKRAAP